MNDLFQDQIIQINKVEIGTRRKSHRNSAPAISNPKIVIYLSKKKPQETSKAVGFHRKKEKMEMGKGKKKMMITNIPLSWSVSRSCI